MGNCCRTGSSSSVVWAGDDWGSVGQEKSSHHGNNNKTMMIERQRLLGDEEEILGDWFNYYSSRNSSLSNSLLSSSSTREVKVKITKRELEELMAKIDIQGLTMEQVLARLINNTSEMKHDEDHHHRHWKPALQSIPEVN